MRFEALFILLVFLGSCSGNYNTSPSSSFQPNEFKQSRQKVLKHKDQWKFRTFIDELAKERDMEQRKNIQLAAQRFFPDSTIHEDHQLQGHLIPYPDSLNLLFYEYALDGDGPLQSNMYLGTFSSEGDAQDILDIKEVSYDGSIAVNLIDGQILEVEYYDFFRKDNVHKAGMYTEHQLDSDVPRWQNVALRQEHDKQNIVEFYYYENYRIDQQGRFIQLSRADSVNLSRQFPHTSIRVLSEEEFPAYSTKELRLMINEIYAAHGYIFRSEEQKAYFIKKDWYKARFHNIDRRLSDIEKINIKKIAKAEADREE